MSERPIIFSAPMVRAILDGRKTQTRRVLKEQPAAGVGPWPIARVPGGPRVFEWRSKFGRHVGYVRLPYAPGDRLWVCEQTWKHRQTAEYRHTDKASDASWHEAGWKKVPGVHMPRHMCRITLEVTGVRVERLQDISEADAKAEGCGLLLGNGADANLGARAVSEYSRLWDSINDGESWAANPWVWVIEFKRLESK